MAKIWRGVFCMSAPDGQDPPQVPHWMQLTKVSPPGVAAMTSSWNPSLEADRCM
jgi:hypothetical protein